MNRAIYTPFRDPKSHEWSASILPVGKQETEKMEGYEDLTEMVVDLHARYGQEAERVSFRALQEEMERRTTHSAEMLALLQNTYAGDLRAWHVYGSSRPMTGISISGAVFLNAPEGTKYKGYWTILAYVCSEEPLDERTLEHYSLVSISHPAANQD